MKRYTLAGVDGLVSSVLVRACGRCLVESRRRHTPTGLFPEEYGCTRGTPRYALTALCVYRINF